MSVDGFRFCFTATEKSNRAICGREAALSKDAFKMEAPGKDANIGQDAAWLQVAAPAAQI